MCNVRSTPEVGASNDVGDLLAPAKPVAFEERQVGSDTLCRIGGNMWAAKCVAGKTYFNYI